MKTVKRKGISYHWLGKGKNNIFTKTEDHDFTEIEKHEIMKLVEDWKDDDYQKKQQEKYDMRQLIEVLKDDEERSTAELIKEGKMHTNDMRDLIKVLVADGMASAGKKRKVGEVLDVIEKRESELGALPNRVLKKKCQDIGLMVSGNKADLVNRIIDKVFGVWSLD